MEKLDFALKLLQFLLWAGTSFYVYMSNKNKVTNDRIAELEKDVDARAQEHGQRIARLEQRVKTSPTHDDLSKLHEKINEVSACVNRLEGEFSGASHTLALIHDYLLNGGRK